GRVLLQGQRVHLAELVQLALRRGRPPLLLGPDVGSGGAGWVVAAVRQRGQLIAGGGRLGAGPPGGGRRGVGRPGGRRRDRHVRAVLRDQRRGVHAELLDRAAFD